MSFARAEHTRRPLGGSKRLERPAALRYAHARTTFRKGFALVVTLALHIAIVAGLLALLSTAPELERQRARSELLVFKLSDPHDDAANSASHPQTSRSRRETSVVNPLQVVEASKSEWSINKIVIPVIEPLSLDIAIPTDDVERAGDVGTSAAGPGYDPYAGAAPEAQERSLGATLKLNAERVAKLRELLRAAMPDRSGVVIVELVVSADGWIKRAVIRSDNEPPASESRSLDALVGMKIFDRRLQSVKRFRLKLIV